METSNVLTPVHQSYRGQKFRANNIDFAELLAPGVIPFRNLTGEARRGAKRQGILYEKRIISLLLEHYTGLRVQPWIRYTEGKSPYYFARPDAILELEQVIILFEIKHSHCVEAYWQLLYYGKLLQFARKKPIRMVEICKHFDADVRFSHPLRVSFSHAEFIEQLPDLNLVEVIKWKP